MKAIILAGGVGSRLRPMTCDRPKPMAPVMDRPVMEYAVQLLKRHGVDKIAATVCYLPEMIRDYFGDGSRFGVKMHYFLETEPLGTAGGVKMAQEMLDETFFVLSGDGLTDCDLTDALRFHREKGALATIVLKQTAMPTEYGVAVTEKDGRIRSFLEKPDWSDVLSDLANTGIYILEPEALRLIPDGAAADFSRDLFPKLMQSGAGVYGYVMEGYWCDIGDVDSYLSAHRAFLQGEIRLDAGFAPGDIRISPGARVDSRARLEAPCCIGPGAVVERDALIGAGSVVGAGARVGRGAVVKRSVLWPDARLEEHAQASGCVLCEGAVLGAGSCAYEASVLGSRSRLGVGAQLMPAMRVWPRKEIPEYSRVEADIVWGSGCALRFKNGRMPMQDPAQAVRFGQAMAEICGKEAVLLGTDGTAGAQACMQAASAGLIAQGAEVLEVRGVSLPVMRALCRALHADAAVYCSGAKMLPLTGAGAETPRETLRKIEKAIAREGMPTGIRQIDRMPRKIEGAQELYLGEIGAYFDRNAPGGQTAVFSPDEGLLVLAQRAFQRAGRACRTEWDADRMATRGGEWGVYLDEDGCIARLSQDGTHIDGTLLRMLLLWTALEAGELSIALNAGEPEAASALCEEYGARVLRVHSGPGEEQAALAKCSVLLLRLQTDGVFAALCATASLEKRGLSLVGWTELLPRMAVLSRVLPVDAAAKGRVLRAFAEEYPGAELGDGIRIRLQRGRVWLRPSSDSAECMLSCEAADMESARDLLGEYADKLLRAAREKK